MPTVLSRRHCFGSEFLSPKDGGVPKGEGFRDLFFRTLQLEHDVPISLTGICVASPRASSVACAFVSLTSSLFIIRTIRGS